MGKTKKENTTMFKEIVFTGIGASTLMREKIEKELKILEKKEKIKKDDLQDFLKSLEKKGKKEDKKIKREIKSMLKSLTNDLDLATKKDLRKLKNEIKKSF